MFFAVLVSSLALAIGIAIYDLVVRELLLASTNEQSQYAIYASDSGWECSLYWDSHYQGTQSIFPVDSSDPAQSATNAPCAGVDVTFAAVHNVSAPPYATTTLSFPMGKFYTSIEVGKKKNADGTVNTIILSHGYNMAPPFSPRAVERELRVDY